MLHSPNQTVIRAGRRGLIAVGFLTTATLGIPTWSRLAERDWQTPAAVSNVVAAEPLPADTAIAAAGEDIANQPGGEKPAPVPKNDAPAVESFPRPTKHEIKITEALDGPTRIEFTDAPFEDCITNLRDYHKINIWIDRQTLIDEGVALDQPITLKLAGVSLRSVLKLLLEPVQLSYVVEDDVLKITTAARASERMVTRIYPVRDLYRGRNRIEGQPHDEKGVPGRLQGEPRPGDLETAIVKSIEPDSWEEKKGPGSLTYVSESGSLVIRQNWWAHGQILQLLRDLREAKRVGQGGPQAKTSPRSSWKLRGPKRDETYSIVGVIDLDGDGESDRDQFHELLKFIGAKIDNEVDEEGVLRVDGEFPDDRQPRFTEKTKFVVLGKVPEPADTSDAQEINTSLKIGEFYKEFEDQAEARGVRVIQIEDFLKYIGYERVDSQPAP